MKQLRIFATIIAILAFSMPALASRLETAAVKSDSMNKDVNVSIVLPDSYGARR